MSDSSTDSSMCVCVCVFLKTLKYFQMLQYKKNNPEVLLPNVKHLEKQSQMQTVMERKR